MANKKDKKPRFQLDFRVAIIIFIAVFLLLIFILLTNTGREIQRIITGDRVNNVSVLESEANNQTELLDVVPFYSKDFSVVYDEQTSRYLISVEPYSLITREEIDEWLMSFSDVNSVSEEFFVFLAPEDRRPTPQP